MENSDYNFSDKLMHYLVLGVPLITKVSFELDDLLVTHKGPNPLNEKHVFISGLARAGTTILMRTFFETGRFQSLTYRDMPFVLMPNLWKKLSQSFQKQQAAKERAHGDGIQVNFDSPEAFEEVFWQTFSGKDYIFDKGLHPHHVSQELIEQFRLYIRRILANANSPEQSRYLSKNNNNILRLSAIQKAFPKSLILIPFRNPLQHAISLFNQHQKFCQRHATDKFSYHYMHWLGHHEFGITHKPFVFENETHFSLADYETTDINYWLNLWTNTYDYLLKNAPSNSAFVCFEDLCEFPVKTLSYLFESMDLLLDENQLNQTFNIPPTKAAEGLNENLKNQAQEIYQALRKLTKLSDGLR